MKLVYRVLQSSPVPRMPNSSPVRISTFVGLLAATLTAIAAAPARSIGDSDVPATPILFIATDPSDLSDALPGDGHCRSIASTCTLRAAFEELAALPHSPETLAEVRLQPGVTYHLTRPDPVTIGGDDGSTALPPVFTGITIWGSGATIDAAGDDASGAFRLFLVGDNGSLDLREVTLSGGIAASLAPARDSGAGGAILNRGRLTLIDCILRNNKTIDGEMGGGALFNAGFADLRRVALTANAAHGGAPAAGGAILNTGELHITDSDVVGNETIGSDFGADGGAIANAGLLLIADSRLRDNRTGGGCLGGNGGAIHNTGEMGIRGSQLDGNAATKSGNGGAVYDAGVTTIDECTFRGNSAGTGSETGGGSGGAIFNRGRMTIARSSLLGNQGGDAAESFDGDGGAGGGLYNSGTVRLTASTIAGNRAGRGGAASGNHGGHGGGVCSSGHLVAINATISDNRAGDGSDYCYFEPQPTASNGGWGGGLFNDGVAILRNVTIAGNVAGARGTCQEETVLLGLYGRGGGIADGGGLTEVANSIIAGNSAPGDAIAGSAPDCVGTVTSRGFNVFGRIPGSCTVEGQHADDIRDPTFFLWPLADNGGATPTRALPRLSPAIDAADPAGCRDDAGTLLAQDQRGAPRPANARCDIGAYERAALAPWPTCPGDCDDDGMVAVHELTAAVAIALGALPASECLAADGDQSGGIEIAELLASVAGALHGCP